MNFLEIVPILEYGVGKNNGSRKDAKDAKGGEIKKVFLCGLCALGAMNFLEVVLFII